MRIPALPQTKQFKIKTKNSLWKSFWKMIVKRVEKKRNFVRIPPRE